MWRCPPYPNCWVRKWISLIPCIVGCWSLPTHVKLDLYFWIYSYTTAPILLSCCFKASRWPLVSVEGRLFALPCMGPELWPQPYLSEVVYLGEHCMGHDCPWALDIFPNRWMHKWTATIPYMPHGSSSVRGAMARAFSAAASTLWNLFNALYLP